MDGVAIDGVQILDERLLESVVAGATQSGRRRLNLNLHRGDGDNPHRFFNVLLRGTYITPHRHLRPPKSETFLILRGSAAFFVFEDDGRIRESHTLSGEGAGASFGIDIQPGLWHTLAVLSEYAVCFEVKPGPYDPAGDKEFAPWAPAEGAPACHDYLQGLLDQHQTMV
jgi:cupin fold WbuC family metalloprotein